MFLFHFMNLDFFWIGDDGDNFSTALGQFQNYVNFQKIFREARLRGVTIERGFSAIELSWQMSISSKYRIAPHVHWTLHHTKCPGCFYTSLSHTEPWMLLVPHWATLRWAFPQFIAQFHALHRMLLPLHCCQPFWAPNALGEPLLSMEQSLGACSSGGASAWSLSPCRVGAAGE